MAQKDIKNRIASVKNIQKITRAMEMVAAARLRRAEQRIEHLRPYAGAIRRMTRQAASAAENMHGLPILEDREHKQNVGLLFVTGDRGLAGAFNSQILRAGLRTAGELGDEGRTPFYYASGKRGASSLIFRGLDLAGRYVGFTDRPAYADARTIGDDLMSRIHRRQARPCRHLLQRLHLAAQPGGAPRDAAATSACDHPGSCARGGR